MIPLDSSIPTVLLIWFQTIADAIPTRARTTVVELVFGCMLTGRGHVTQAIAAITPRRGWRAYFRMIETGGFSWLDIVHALCRIVRDSFVRQDCCVMALDDTLLLRSSKKAPGAARRFDHAGKPNRPRHVLAQNLVSLSTVIGPPGRRRSLPLVSRLSDDGLDGGKLAKILIGAVLHQLRPDILLVDAWFMRARLVLWAVARGITVVGQARLDTALFLRPRARTAGQVRHAVRPRQARPPAGRREAPRRLPQCADPLPQLPVPGPLPRRSGGPRRLDLAARQGALDQEPAAAVDRSDHAAGGDHPALCRPLDN